MPSPELPLSEFDRAPEPGGEGSGLPGPRNPQQSPLCEDPPFGSCQPSIDPFGSSIDKIHDNIDSRSEATYPPPIAGGQDLNNTKSSQEQPTQPELGDAISGEGTYEDAPFDPLTEDRKLLPRTRPSVGRTEEVNWREEISENGQKLFKCLLEERGDTDLLPIYAEEDRFDLEAALNELRGHGMIDESDPSRVRLISRRL